MDNQRSSNMGGGGRGGRVGGGSGGRVGGGRGGWGGRHPNPDNSDRGRSSPGGNYGPQASRQPAMGYNRSGYSGAWQGQPVGAGALAGSQNSGGRHAGGRGGGSRGGGSRGGGRGHVHPSPQRSIPHSLQSGLSNLRITPSLEVEDGKRVPMRRPDNGGTRGAYILSLSVNHFQLNSNRSFSILCYEIDVKMENRNNAEAIRKSDLISIKKKLFDTESSSLPYDGGRSLVSSRPLQEGNFPVELHGTSYIVSVMLQKELTVADLGQPPFSREFLHGLDTITRHNSAMKCIQAGRSFYFPGPYIDLGRGVGALEGFRQSIKPTENGLVVCVDYSVMPFWKPVDVLTYLNEVQNMSFDESSSLYGKKRADVEAALRNMRVTTTHRKTSQKHTVCGLTIASTDEIKFFDDKQKMERRLIDYYRDTYGIDIKYKKLPCLSLSKNKTNYVPMELCKLIDGQLFPKDRLHKDGIKKLRDMALPKPMQRMDMILNMVDSRDGPCKGKTLENFSLTFSPKMMDATARVLEPPSLKLLNPDGDVCPLQIPIGDCQWNLLNNKVLVGKQITRWAILDFSRWQSPRNNNRLQTFNVDQFIRNLVKRCCDVGVSMNHDPVHVEESWMEVLSDPRELQKTILKCKSDNLQLLICPMAERHDGYKMLKLICETEIGIVTQCCLINTVNDMKRKDQSLANLALKINAKLGGNNFELDTCLPGMDRSCPVIFIGADVNHPSSWNTSSPSIVAVVATTNWPASNNYASIVRSQEHRREDIVNIGSMCCELIENYAHTNGVKPSEIIYFRDGVSDSQFDMVLNKELSDIKVAIESDSYKPKVTVVVAQKRHQTRLFLKNSDARLSRSGNVPPGTVVDKGITAPNSFNFFLCSHNGILGTSKPTHYYVLWDEHGYTSDQLQKLIYDMCFTFARCTKPVSLVPPVYYADLLAYRGRMYYEAMDLLSPASSPSTFSGTVELPELHVSIKKGMFFL